MSPEGRADDPIVSGPDTKTRRGGWRALRGLPRRDLLVSAGALAFFSGRLGDRSTASDRRPSVASPTAGPAEPGDSIGTATDIDADVDVDGDGGNGLGVGVGVVGTAGSGPLATHSEAVYLLGIDGDEPAPGETLTPQRPGSGFGCAVGVSGSTVVVGADFAALESGVPTGALTVFGRTDGRWSRTARLTPPDPLGIARFGSAVATTGDSILVGAPRARSNGRGRTGGAYLYHHPGPGETWELEATLVPADPVEQVGTAVALDERTAVVGARVDDARPETAGLVAVYARRRGGWVQEARLTPPAGVREAGFGEALAVDGDTVVVGAPAEQNENGAYAGAAYVFTRDGRRWRLSRRLLAPNGASDERFGTAVDVAGARVVVGAEYGRPSDGGRSDRLGSTAVFRLPAGDTGPVARSSEYVDSHLGTAVAIDGATALVAADRSRAAGTGVADVISV